VTCRCGEFAGARFQHAQRRCGLCELALLEKRLEALHHPANRLSLFRVPIETRRLLLQRLRRFRRIVLGTQRGSGDQRECESQDR